MLISWLTDFFQLYRTGTDPFIDPFIFLICVGIYTKVVPFLVKLNVENFLYSQLKIAQIGKNYSMGMA